MNCRRCGQPLAAGNIKVVRRAGKRAYRVHKTCPENQPLVEANEKAGFTPVKTIEAKGMETAEAKPSVIYESTAGTPVEVVYKVGRRYRFFIQPASVDKLKRELERGNAWFNGFTSEWSLAINIQVVPVLEEVVEAMPEAAAQFIEIEIDLGEDRNG